MVLTGLRAIYTMWSEQIYFTHAVVYTNVNPKHFIPEKSYKFFLHSTYLKHEIWNTDLPKKEAGFYTLHLRKSKFKRIKTHSSTTCFEKQNNKPTTEVKSYWNKSEQSVAAIILNFFIEYDDFSCFVYNGRLLLWPLPIRLSCELKQWLSRRCV